MNRQYGPKGRTNKDKRAAAVAMLLWRPSVGETEVDLLMRAYGQSESDARQLVDQERMRRSGSE